MPYFHSDDDVTVAFLANVLNEAVKNGNRIRIDVDGAGRIRVKRGEGIWSPPICSTFDHNRDNSPGNENVINR